jgi:hypothetical protein
MMTGSVQEGLKTHTKPLYSDGMSKLKDYWARCFEKM